MQFNNINLHSLKQALTATSQKRGSYEVISNYKYIMETVKNSQVMQEQWQLYQKNFEYAKDVDFRDACDMVVQVMDEMNGESI